MFTRTRTINGKKYRYLEERYRQGGKVRSRSTYLGAGEWPVGSYMDLSLEDMKKAVQLYKEKEALNASAPVVTPTSSNAAPPPSDSGDGTSQGEPR